MKNGNFSYVIFIRVCNEYTRSHAHLGRRRACYTDNPNETLLACSRNSRKCAHAADGAPLMQLQMRCMYASSRSSTSHAAYRCAPFVRIPWQQSQGRASKAFCDNLSSSAFQAKAHSRFPELACASHSSTRGAYLRE